MSDQVNVGDYSLEIDGGEVVVRDESGTVVETVELDNVDGELTLPDGQKVDLASLMADAGVENFQTAAGPANDNLGYINGGSGGFRSFHGTPDELGGLDSAGTLGGTSLGFDALNTDKSNSYDPQQETPAPVTWSPHDRWSVAEDESGVSFGRIVKGNPTAFKFEVSDDRFEVVDGVLRLREGVSLDYETESAIELEITAISPSGGRQTLPVHIDVTDVNEAQTDFAIAANAANENMAGAVIGNLTVADPDAGDSQSFQVSDSRFEVVDGQLKLKAGIALDHESEPTITVTVTATDEGGHQIQRTVTINVTDVNEAQTALSLDGSSVAENAAGAVIGTLTVADPDTGDSQAFQVSDNRFEVVDGQLKLKDGVFLDHESEPTVSVTVTATDGAGHQIQQTFDIAVGEANEAQSALSLDGSSIAENAAGAVVGNLTVTDPDAGDSQAFQVSDNRFEVVDGQLKLKEGVSLDHESEPSVNVTVTATDGAGHQIQQTFAIAVGDVNEAQTALSMDGSTVAENTAGAVIGTLTVADPDADDSQAFQVSDNRFEVVDGQLKLKDGISLDRESEPSVNVTVTATDGAGHQIQQTFAIAVGDASEAPTDINLSGNAVVENVAGAVIGSLSVVDPDAGDSHSFEVSDSRFEVVNGQLKLKDGISLDFESEPSLNVTVTTTDSAGNKVQETFSLSVGDANEAPAALSLDHSQIPENAAGAVVGTLTVADPDAGDVHSYAVSDSRFEVVNGQLKLKDGASLNYEAEASVDVTVTATDSGGLQIQQTFTIQVGDVNEAQTALTWTGNAVKENAAGAVVGSLSVADPDAGDAQTFKVSDSRFEVVNDQLKLKPGVSLDFEQGASVGVTVTATDKAGHEIQQTFTVNVQNVNEAQTGMSLSASKVAENAAGAVIGTLGTADPDAGDTQSYTVSDSRFEVVNDTLKLKSGVSINYEAESSINVTVAAKDTGGNQYSKAFTIEVTDVNEAQTGMSLSAGKVAENAAGAAIGIVTTADPDAGDTQSYTVSDSRFEVVNNTLKLKSGVSLDYEGGSTVNVTVTATDKGQHQYTKAFTVTVTDANEAAPVVIAKDGAVHTHTVDTNLAYSPNASATVGNYLYSNDSAGVKAPPAGALSSISSANMTLAMDTEVQVTFQKEAAGNRNMVGTYQYDDTGNIVPGSVKFVWLDASAASEGQIGATMVKDFLGYAQSNTVSLGTMEAGTHVGFFTISNGAGDSSNRTLIAGAAAGASDQSAAMDALNSQLSIKIDGNGNGRVYLGNTQMAGDVFFTHDKALNTDFNGNNDIVHMTSGVSANLPGQLLIGVEDLNGGGDKDFNDVVFSVNLGTYNINKITQEIVQPSVDFSDADSSALSRATIETSGFQSGDVLNVPASGLFDVSVVQTGAEYSITITGKNGGETLDQYENFVNSIYFSTSSKVEGDRHIDYSVTDSGGLTSAVATADITVDSDYRLSTSELGHGKATLSGGDDTLFINTNSYNPVDAGDGYDSVHLAQNNRSFDHNDAVKLSNVEEVDTTGYGVNNVSLSIHDVLNMTDGDNRLTIVGDQGDNVTLTSNGNNHWTIVESTAEFTTYAYSDPAMQAVVEISNQLNAQVS